MDATGSIGANPQHSHDYGGSAATAAVLAIGISANGSRPDVSEYCVAEKQLVSVLELLNRRSSVHSEPRNPPNRPVSLS